jgi:hypothetical protein
MNTQQTNPAYTIGVILLISFWWWCSRRVKRKNLPLDWYMWPVAFVWGAGIFGLAVYDWYRRKQIKKEENR